MFIEILSIVFVIMVMFYGHTVNRKSSITWPSVSRGNDYLFSSSKDLASEVNGKDGCVNFSSDQ